MKARLVGEPLSRVEEEEQSRLAEAFFQEAEDGEALPKPKFRNHGHQAKNPNPTGQSRVHHPYPTVAPGSVSCVPISKVFLYQKRR